MVWRSRAEQRWHPAWRQFRLHRRSQFCESPGTWQPALWEAARCSIWLAAREGRCPGAPAPLYLPVRGRASADAGVGSCVCMRRAAASRTPRLPQADPMPLFAHFVQVCWPTLWL